MLWAFTVVVDWAKTLFIEQTGLTGLVNARDFSEPFSSAIY